MAAAFPSPFKYHRDTYEAIDPSSQRLSTKGKNVVITGGGAGIGPEIARAFATSGASSVSILGRTEKTLVDKKAELDKEFPNTKFLTHVADIVNKESLVSAFDAIKATVGNVDVLVANAGYLPDINKVVDIDINDWFTGYEINVKGNFNLITAFLPVAAKGAAVINISTGITHLQFIPGYSGYHTSKLASAKFFEYVHHEHPELFVVNVHPGVIKTDMDKKTAAAGIELPYDEIALPAHFVNWLVSDEARPFNGKFLWAHWDVEELVARKSGIAGTENLTFGLIGWPALVA